MIVLTNTQQRTNNINYFYLDILRALATFAVVIIHVLGPWRHLFGVVPEYQWQFAVSYNAITRWAVPIFMMISGALLVSASSPFQPALYFKKRVSKVLVPFVAWSLFYCTITWWQHGGESIASWLELISELTHKPAWYHLWFFYDFIPLCIVAPLLALLLKRLSAEQIKSLLAAWLVLTVLHWFKLDGWFRQNLLLYSGYLLLGWYLHQHDCRAYFKPLLLAGITMLVLNVAGTLYLSELQQRYSVFFMGYKSFNTVVIAVALFLAAKMYSHRLLRLKPLITNVASYSLGIYLIHPLLLLPIRRLENGVYGWFGNNLLAIAMISVITLLLSLLATRLLAMFAITKRLVP